MFKLTSDYNYCFQSLIAAAMVLYGTIDSLIDFFSFTAWIFYGGAMVALIVMRYTKPNYPRPYKVPVSYFLRQSLFFFNVQVPIIIPYLVLVISFYLIIGPIIDKPTIEYLYAALFILGGMIFYVPFVHYKMRIPFMGKLEVSSLRQNNFFSVSDGVTVFLQMIFEVAPTSTMLE